MRKIVRKGLQQCSTHCGNLLEHYYSFNCSSNLSIIQRLFLSHAQLRIQEKLVYDDLDGSLDDKAKQTGAPLNLTHVDRYLHGPVPGSVTTEATTEELQKTLSELKRDAANWINGNSLPRQPSSSLVSSAAAVSALGELTPGGALMKGFREDNVGRECSSNNGKKTIKIYFLKQHFLREK